ncbi:MULTISPECIES: hypothetical protein [Kamptonema]|uniref:hypothetical protein n=1 Tax=Kamptonema TaxID=1501433 RepID=UPI0008FC087D|nr:MULTISPECIES: hypothetical protein [Kamptonema]
MSAKKSKNFLPFFLFLAVVFVMWGDSFTFLPKPVKDASLQSRNFVVGLWPKWLKPKNTNEQRQKDIENLEQKASPSP